MSRCLLAASVLFWASPLLAVAQEVDTKESPAPSPQPTKRSAGAGQGVEAEPTPRITTTITVTANPGPVKSDLSSDVRTLPANSSVIDPGALERASAREPGEVLRGLSGVDFVYYGQGGIPSGPSVRGYTDRNFGQDIAGFLDGIPLNLFGFVASHGALDLTPVFTPAVARVDLVRGPLDVRYGDFHRGGSVNFVTRDGVPRPSVTIAGGSFGAVRGALTYGNRSEASAGTTVFLNAEGYNSNGYADNQRVKHFKTFNKLSWQVGGGDMTLALQGYWADWDAPSYLDRDLVRGGALDEKAAVNPTDGGNQNNQLTYLRYRHGAASGDPLTATAYFVHRDWKRWRSDFLISPTQTQVQQVDQRITYGLRVEKDVGRTLFGRPSIFLVGAAIQRDDAETRQDRTVQRESIGATDNVDELLTNLGVYAQEQIQAANWLKLMAGLRYSHVDYDIHDNLRAPGAFVASYDADVFSPKVGVAVSLGNHVGAYANYATGMRSPTPRTEIRNSVNSVDRVEIAETESYEAGLTARISTKLELLGAVWRADNSNEIRGIPPGGVQFESLGRSRREGAEAEINWYPVQRTRIYLGVSWVDAVLKTPTNPLANHLPDIPEYVHKLGFETHVVRTGRWPGTLSIAADFAIHGPKDLNTLGTIRADKYERITTSIAYTVRERYRLWLGGFAYPGSRIEESAFLFGQRVGVRANPSISMEGGITYTF